MLGVINFVWLGTFLRSLFTVSSLVTSYRTPDTDSYWRIGMNQRSAVSDPGPIGCYGNISSGDNTPCRPDGTGLLSLLPSRSSSLREAVAGGNKMGLDSVQWRNGKQKFMQKYRSYEQPFIDTHCHLDFLFER